MTLAKSLKLPIVIALAMTVSGSPATAKEVDLGKHTEGDIRGTCEREGGSFVSNGQVYGCSKACTGGTCHVICDKDDGCIGVTPGRRQPGVTGERGVVDALNAALVTTEENGSKDFPWGLIGLLGLVGLIGIRGRDDRASKLDAGG